MARCASGTCAGSRRRAPPHPSAASPASSATRWAAPPPRPCSRPEPPTRPGTHGGSAPAPRWREGTRRPSGGFAFPSGWWTLEALPGSSVSRPLRGDRARSRGARPQPLQPEAPAERAHPGPSELRVPSLQSRAPFVPGSQTFPAERKRMFLQKATEPQIVIILANCLSEDTCIEPKYMCVKVYWNISSFVLRTVSASTQREEGVPGTGASHTCPSS